MAIVKNNFRVSRLEEELSPGGRDSMSTDDEELQHRSSTSDSEDNVGDDVDEEDEDDDDDDVDSGAGSDDFDISELGEIGEEFCQVGNQSCSIPYELYDLPGLGEILSQDVWNDLLTEEERFSLAEYLPDMDQDTFTRTLKELFSGDNFHFGSPVVKLFKMLKGGVCQPRVALYRQGLNYLQKREHYHHLRRYQNSMVGTLVHIRDAWANCKGYSIEERLRVLNIRRSQRSLMYESMQDLGVETESPGREESLEGLWTRGLKDIRVGSKMGPRAVYTESPIMDASSRGRAMALEPAKYVKQNQKGILKLSGSKVPSRQELVGRSPIHHGFETKSRPYSSKLALPWQNQGLKYDLEASHHRRGQIKSEEELEDPSYGMTLQRDQSITRGSTMAKPKHGRKQEFLKSEDYYGTESFADSLLSLKNDNLHSHGRNRNMNQMADMEMLRARQVGDRTPYDYHSRDAGKNSKYLNKLQLSAVDDQMNMAKDRAHLSLKGMRVDWSDGSQPFRHKKPQEAFSMDQSVKFDGRDVRSKKSKMGQEFRTGKNSATPTSKGKSYIIPHQTNDAFFPSDYRGKTSQMGSRMNSMRNGGLDMEDPRDLNMFTQSEETESDSSEQVDEEEDYNPFKRKVGYGGLSAPVKSVLDPKKVNKLVRKDKEYAQSHAYSSKKVGHHGDRLRMPEVQFSSLKGKSKGKILNPSYSHNHAASVLQESDFCGPAKLVDDRKLTHKSAKNGHMQGDPAERMHPSLLKVLPAERKNKGKVDHDNSFSQSKYMHDYMDEEEGNFISRLERGQDTEAHANEHHERSHMSLSGCNSVPKKRKGKAELTYMDGLDGSDHLHSGPNQQIDDPSPLKKRGKRKVEAQTGSLAMVTSRSLVSEREVADLEPDTKPAKKPFTLITPTVHTGFSFSIIHLLSAVRMAMITPFSDDDSQVGKHHGKGEREKLKREDVNGGPHYHGSVDQGVSENMGMKNLPSLTVQEIVSRVRSNPGDPCILETQEPLQDLVRGVLKIFSSKTAPLGAKAWKALVIYEKSTKSWSWIGPVSSSSSDPDAVEEETSSEAWGLPHKMLVKLVDSFANWLKSGQETLQQIGSLPAPPLTLMQPILDEKERFRDLRAQKSLTTISPSSEEVRAYFRREEVLRYLVPDRAFSYTAADGRKSTVAPLRRCGGKPTSKARDHFMLKIDRPPHVTILCLVRDAAARLPGSIGTRADVCTLIRDSQYIVEDVADAQVNQVVSGALDRLHYERDPCVQFDGDRKLWVYLHRDREEEDFDDDGTASTKKWKRQRKDPSDQSDMGAVTVAFHGAGEHNTLDSDLNVEPSSTHGEERTEVVYNKDLRSSVEEKTGPFVASAQSSGRQGQPVGWDVIGLNPVRESKMLCQENSTNEDFDDDTFNRERPVGGLSRFIDHKYLKLCTWSIESRIKENPIEKSKAMHLKSWVFGMSFAA
ncbi:Nuclear factor related to kappa-B-binding protein [Macleaya cordata]|uniref:Nuclear factor related to kappa-B-binding protein n=1 Tax=Macleaya cordata TaxID=56857 RepID=A0A200QHR2_MACCD|nr:Nuclear factor related to kappa-B-binding protein [Macleaya cordata]